jgi:hypothetical protein
MAITTLLAATAAAGGDDVSRLESSGGSLKSTIVPPGRTEHFGHAETIIAAPVSFVREQATDFTHYKDLSNGRIRTSRLVDKHPGSTDVYFQLPVLHGLVTLWQVLRFSDVNRNADGTETFTGKLVSGNVRAAEMTITIRPAGAGRSIASCDLLVTPEFAAPQAAVDAELRDAAESALRAVASRAEQKFVQATPQPTQTAVAIDSSRDGGT